MSKPKKAIKEFRNYELPPDFPIIVLHGDRWQISDVKASRLHFHNCLELGVCHSGSGFMSFDDDEIEFAPGDITIISKNLPHTTFSREGQKSLWSYIFIDPELFFRNSTTFDGLSGLIAQNNFRKLNRDSYPMLYEYIMAVINEMNDKKPGYRISVQGLMAALCMELIRMFESNVEDIKLSGDNQLAISPALNYISENYMQQFTINDLADMCHLSVTHFRRLFLSMMGVTPLEYVNNTRIDRACILLSTSSASILEISEMVGFHTVSSFNRAFDKVIGMSPRKWRNERRPAETVVKKQDVMEYRGWT